ncbi:hypothetical protein KVV02_006179 [Mortierella alpina]|uniref:Uncharacterized protein n=1 Tax=Mortierella alpina TaxID=64518 RepID=A0A9P8A8H1_MORAP|nr:hypothetical protein KVV02_006179 [Mortierella alpina]
MTSGIMVVSVATNSRHSKEMIAAKDNENSKQQKNSKPIKSPRSSISAHHVEQLDHTPSTRPASPSDLISKLSISSSQASSIPRTSISSPTDSAFSPGPMSASIDMPSTPSAPCTPSTPDVDRYLSSSPEPVSPTLPSAPAANASLSGSSGSRFAAMFSKGHRSSEESVRQQENGTGQDQMPMQQEPKKKRLSAGSIQAPISHFLNNTFRSSKQGPSAQQQPQPKQQVGEEVQQSPVQRKKRRSLLPKLPKLDTRPKIIISSPMKKGGRSEKKQQEARAQGQEEQGSSTPGLLSSSSPVSGSGRGLGGAGHSFALALLSPFYLPAHLRPAAFNKDSSKSVQQAPPLFDSASLWNWRQHSRVYYDDRWDRASVLSADSDMARLSEDPNFPGYPERNEFWQKHCRIRERRLQKQHLQRQLSGMGFTAGADQDDSDDDESEDEDVKNLGPARMGPGGSRLRHTSSRHQNRCGKNRVRYTTYSAYMAAMQLKAKNRAERKNSDASLAPKVNAKLLEDMRLLQQRSMNQEANVKTIADKLQKGTNSVRPSMDLDGQLQHQQRLERRMNGTNLGSSDDDSDGQGRQQAGRPSMSLPRRRQPDSGILFVPSSATTAEMYPNLVHDPLGHLYDSGRSTPSRMDYFRTAGQNTCTVGKDGFGDVVGIEDEKIGCLVASYFDKRLFEEGSESDGGGYASGLPGAHSRRSSPSKACRNSVAVEDNEDRTVHNGGSSSRSSNSRLKFDKEDLCLSQPGQYASHNHISLPGTLSSHPPLIHDLLSTHPAFNLVCDSTSVTITGDNSVSPACPPLQQNADLTAHPATVTYTPLHRSSGHMIVMLSQGQCRYYRNGTRDRGPQWNDSEFHENGVIDEEDEEEDEEDAGSAVHHIKGKGKEVLRSEEQIPVSEGAHRQLCHFQEQGQAMDSGRTEQAADTESNVSSFPNPRPMSFVDATDISHPRSSSSDPLSSMDKPLSDPSSFSGCASDPDSNSNSASSLPPLPESVSNSASRKSSLARIRGAKSRASVSYSVPPPITTISFSSIATTADSGQLSASTSTLPSTAPSTRSTSLRHRVSGSMTPGSMTTGVTTPATPSTPLTSPNTMSWPDLSRYPSSASAMLLDALSKPMTTAYLLQHKDNEHRPPEQSREGELGSGSLKGSRLLRASTGSTSSSFSTQSKRWMRKSIFRASSDGCVHPAGTAQHALQTSLQRRRPSRTWGYPGTTDEEEANEAEREMAQEIVISESGASGHNSSRCQSPVGSGMGGIGSKSPQRKRSRTLSMVELSASTSASQYALSSPAMTHRRYKAEALTSTTKVDMLRSEGEYEWNEFFDY